MRSSLCFALLTLLLASCASNAPYRPASHAERFERAKAYADIYPEQVRTHLEQYTNTVVAWAGIILDTDTDNATNGLIQASSILEHHYYDWEADRRLGQEHIYLSPKGEGRFRIVWHLRQNDPSANANTAREFAGPGQLALVYGVPKAVEDGVVVLQYRYLRVIGQGFDTNTFDYGRFGTPVRPIAPAVTATP